MTSTLPRTATNVRPHALVVSLFLLALLVVGPAAAADRWFHITVEEKDGTSVAVNLPLTLIESAARLIPEEIDDEVRVELNEEGFDLDELRELWQEVRDSQDATFLTVKEEDTTIEVRKEGAYFVARTIDRSEYGADVNVRFPLEVVDALFSGPEGTLDLAAAVRALADHGDGDMVTVDDGRSNVRIWVDDSN